MPTGTVKFFNESKGFGFIQPARVVDRMLSFTSPISNALE